MLSEVSHSFSCLDCVVGSKQRILTRIQSITERRIDHWQSRLIKWSYGVTDNIECRLDYLVIRESSLGRLIDVQNVGVFV